MDAFRLRKTPKRGLGTTFSADVIFNVPDSVNVEVSRLFESIHQLRWPSPFRPDLPTLFGALPFTLFLHAQYSDWRGFITWYSGFV